MNNRPKDPKTARNKNVLVIGGSGSGKTRFFVKPNLMQCVSKDYPTSFVITDPKGSLIGEVGQLLIRSSYRVKVLNTINFSKSMKYNPFRYLHSEKDVLKLVNTLICNTKGEGEKSAEDFWVKSERLFYTALIGYIWQEAPEEEMNFTTLLEMINASEAREDDPEFQSPVDLMFERLEERDPDHFAVRQYKKFLLSAGKTRSSILISAGARMAPFDIREVRELMEDDELELDTIGDEKTALFLIMSDTDTTFNFILAMVQSQLINLLCDRADDKYGGRLPVHVRMILDEFANIGQIPNFDKLIATIRSREISASIILQSQSQLKAIYKDAAEIISDNCDCTLFLSGRGKNAKEISDVLGKETIDSYNQSENRGAQTSHGLNYQKLGKISNFKKEKYHVVHIAAGGMEAASDRFLNPDDADATKTACAGAQAVCVSVKREKKTEQPPRLYDLTTLQREANRLFGFTAKQTLDYAQQLYEKKLLTYPRTDSQYLTDDMQPTAESIVSGLWPLLSFAAGLDIAPQFGRVLNSKKVSDHHAIIPTMEFVQKGFDGLTEGEKKLLSLVCCKLLCAVAAPHVYEAVTATFTCAGNEFTAKGKTILTPGWKEIERRFKASFKTDADEDAPELARELPEITEGQTFDPVEASITEHFTTPPKPYTEDTLLSTMERAGAEDMPEDAERQGLGTPATRASILEKLVQMGFVERKGKQLLPTKDGHNLVCVLPDVLTSPQLTAEWETKLTAIAKGEADPEGFMAGIEEMTRGLISRYSQISEDAQKLFQTERVVIGKCPRCGEAVYEGKKNYYCGNRACQFVMWKNDRFFEERGKTFTSKIAAALLKDGKAKVKGLRSMKTGKTYDGTVLLADTGGKYVNYRVEKRS